MWGEHCYSSRASLLVCSFLCLPSQCEKVDSFVHYNFSIFYAQWTTYIISEVYSVLVDDACEAGI